MSKIIKLRKGLDINLQGKASESLAEVPLAKQYAVSPLDFEGLTPKLLVKVGDKVKTGQDVVVLEAMKMENSIASDFEGTVVRIDVNVGDTVAENAPLVEIG